MESKDILNRISKMEEELVGLKKSLTPERLPYNAWYKCNDNIAFFTENRHAYGVSLGYWYDNDGWGELNNGFWSPATDSEVESMLIKEAEKRGYKVGVKFNSLIHNMPVNLMSDGQIGMTNQGFMYYGCAVMKDGKWAEIIKDDKIMIGRYEVEIIGNNVYVNKEYYTKEEVMYCGHILNLGFKISVGCSHQYNLDLETVNKILSKL